MATAPDKGKGKAAPPTRRLATRNPWHVQVVQGASSDSQPSVMAIFGATSRRYLFHAPEGTSRACVQSRIALGIKRLGHVFLPGVETDCSGGLFGTILGASDQKASGEMKVVGPRGTEHLLASARLFTKRDNIGVKVEEVSTEQDGWQRVLEDENLAVYALPTLPERQTSDGRAEDRSPLLLKRKLGSRSPSPLPRKRPHTVAATSTSASPQMNGSTSRESPSDPSRLRGAEAETWRQSVIADMFGLSHLDPPLPPDSPLRGSSYSRQRLPSPWDEASSSRRRVAISYLAIGPPQRGRFLPQKAKAFGVKPGPDFALLANGERLQVSSKTEDGHTEKRWVEPEECMEEAEQPSAFFVAYCPTRQHIDSLTRCSLLPNDTALSHPLEGADLKAVFHVVGPSVLDDDRYQTWIKTAFPASTKHYIGSMDHGPDHPAFGPAALLQLRLSRLSPSLFPLPFSSSTSKAPLPPLELHEMRHADKIQMTKSASPSMAGDGVEIRRYDFDVPSPAADREAERLKGENDSTKEKALGKKAWEAYVEAAKAARTEVEAEAERRRGRVKGAADDLIVTTLGTGSAVPSKYRNVSATLIQDSSDDGSILLDVGEGTLGRLKRHFGEEWRGILADLRIIFISHLHADHHVGLTALLGERSLLPEANGKPVILVAGYGIFLHLLERSDLQDFVFKHNVIWIDANRLLNSQRGDTNRDRDAISEALPSLNVTTVAVNHWGRCFGLVVEHRGQGWKVVYSGDTRPDEGLIDAGLNADLLIHEATIEDSLPETADYKGHSTVGQAIDVGRRMRAKHCLLTHFSARYPKVPRLAPAPGNEPASVDVAAKEVICHEMDVAISFDSMRTRVGDLWRLERFMPAFEALFSDGEEDADTVDHTGIHTTTGEEEGARASDADIEPSRKQLKRQKRREAKALPA